MKFHSYKEVFDKKGALYRKQEIFKMKKVSENIVFSVTLKNRKKFQIYALLRLDRACLKNSFSTLSELKRLTSSQRRDDG